MEDHELKNYKKLFNYPERCKIPEHMDDLYPLKMGDRFAYWINGMPEKGRTNIMTALTLVAICSMMVKIRNGDRIWRWETNSKIRKYSITENDRDVMIALDAMEEIAKKLRTTTIILVDQMKRKHYQGPKPKRIQNWDLDILNNQPAITNLKQGLIGDEKIATKIRALIEANKKKETSILDNNVMIDKPMKPIPQEEAEIDIFDKKDLFEEGEEPRELETQREVGETHEKPAITQNMKRKFKEIKEIEENETISGLEKKVHKLKDMEKDIAKEKERKAEKLRNLLRLVMEK
jgi:hypothetical protein